MYASKMLPSLIAAASLVLGATAAPATKEPMTVREMRKRYDANAVDCEGSYKTHSGAIPTGSGFGWTVYIPQPIGLHDGGYCGDNFLNFLRAQQSGCESASSYQCQPITDDAGTNIGVLIGFDTTIFCGTGQVQKAIWDSTSPQLENSCSMQQLETSPEDILGAIIGSLEGLGDVAGEVYTG